MIKEFKLDFNQLDKEWKDLVPINEFYKLKNKKIYIELSKLYIIIPYNLGIELVNKIKQQKVDLTVNVNKYLEHYGTNIKILFSPKKYFN
jgi:hypothetical protein